MKRPFLCMMTSCILLAMAGCSEPITHSAPPTETTTTEPIQTTTTQNQAEAADPVDTTTSITTADTTTTETTTTEAASVLTTRCTTTSATTTARQTTETKSTTTTAVQNTGSAFVGAWSCVSIEQDGNKQPLSAYATLYGIEHASMTMQISADGTFSATATLGADNRPVSGTWTEQNGTAVFTAEGSSIEGAIRDGQLVLYNDADKVFFTK